MGALFEAMTAPATAWRVRLDEGQLRWSDGSRTFGSEPGAGFGRRFQARLARWLPVEALLRGPAGRPPHPSGRN